ncbi:MULTISPECIES: efflux RND transporter periplasmic adaptor subunit [Bradyrhizobium]|uniref:efflux RND transporter periplasmic adaptor subunit n=1 Tax=Bradyrhizobium TaxID=374 RepID=UPI000231D942|nr:efflux RND transporter periplasmic adaptor subunit [Bradyrhizobium japonicum]AJA64826.1 RND transporter [Bradyrhizobium japonicum]KMJ97455.1 RND transporter [Bradyrhizobium japonicum]MBR0764533.1 efflux RND transporter periplasmic adaptor subunit [Bradyrhizobium japonicum]MCS3538209.1 multidrug efflux system membrane fusion protein [Bradyrhizobium japonicum]MCS3985704.1 multidrug efflux system membrane fusion protein [Bradyrhizobium japonicum]
MSTRPKLSVALFGILAIAAVAYGVWYELLGGVKPAAAAAQSAASQAAVKIPVTSFVVKKADFPVRAYGLGVVSPFKTVTVKSRVDGQIIKVFFKQGQMVKEGDPLLEIDQRPFTAALEQAVAKKAQDEANLRNDRLNLERFQKLAKQQFETQQNLDTQQALVDQMTAQVKGDQAAIDNAQTNLGYTSIKAPISGRTGFRLVDPGNIVHAADTTGIVTIAQLQPIAVQFTEPEEQLQAIDKAFDAGEVPVEALTSDGTRTLSQGRLVVMDNSVNQATGTISLKARFDNKDNALWPGLSVTTRMLIDTRKDVIVVPQDGVQHGPSGLFAYVIGDNGKVSARPIKVSQSGDANAVVSEGLHVGDRIVVAGQSRLFDGALVEEADAAASIAPTTNASAEVSQAKSGTTGGTTSGTKTGSAD